jgi:hypothetical protein
MFAHREPIEFSIWMKGKIGEKQFEEIRKQSQIIIDNPREFLEQKSKELCG